MTIAYPTLWTPSRSRFGNWWRCKRAWFDDTRAAMGHLKKGPGGHLLKGPTGHLVKGCGSAAGTPCSYCSGDTPATRTVTVSGITPFTQHKCTTYCNNYSYAWSPNGTYTVTQDPSSPCGYEFAETRTMTRSLYLSDCTTFVSSDVINWRYRVALNFGPSHIFVGIAFIDPVMIGGEYNFFYALPSIAATYDCTSSRDFTNELETYSDCMSTLILGSGGTATVS